MTSLAVVSETQLRNVEHAIAQATHSFTDTTGDRLTVSTIDSKTLTTAALMALQIATGMVVWPADQTLKIPRAKPTRSVVSIED